MVNANAHQGVFDPHDDPVTQKCLENNHCNREKGTNILKAEETVPTKEQDRPKTSEREGVEELTCIEHAKLHAGIFDVIPRDKFRFTFCHVKGSASEFGNGSNQEDYRTQWSKPDEPNILLFDDRSHSHGTRKNRWEQQSGEHGNF